MPIWPKANVEKTNRGKTKTRYHTHLYTSPSLFVSNTLQLLLFKMLTLIRKSELYHLYYYKLNSSTKHTCTDSTGVHIRFCATHLMSFRSKLKPVSLVSWFSHWNHLISQQECSYYRTILTEELLKIGIRWQRLYPQFKITAKLYSLVCMTVKMGNNK